MEAARSNLPVLPLLPRLNDSSRCSATEDPEVEIKVLENRPLTPSDDGAAADNFVQISPQRVRMRVRVGQEATLDFRVAQAKAYPVDLYYLMDLSNSMSDDKENIVRLGDDLAWAIKNITKDFRIGFGSFVDKEVMPFISLVPGKNCQQESCPRPYSFQHQMRLSRDAKLFQRRVQEAPISGNIDNPEGGFDGLVQVRTVVQSARTRPPSPIIVRAAVRTPSTSISLEMEDFSPRRRRVAVRRRENAYGPIVCPRAAVQTWQPIRNQIRAQRSRQKGLL